MLRNLTLLVIVVLVTISCGGGGSSSSTSVGGGNTTPSPAADTTSPVVSFNPATLTVSSGMTGNATVTASDNVGVTFGPSVTCTNGGSFSGSTFAAPSTATVITSVCTATASDAAGNSGVATLTVTITQPASGSTVAVYNPPLKLTIGTGATIATGSSPPPNVIAVRNESGSNDLSIVFIGGPPGSGPSGYADEDYLPVEGAFNGVSFVDFDSLGFNLFNLFADDFSVLSENDDTLRWFLAQRSSDGLSFTFRQADSLSIEDPCYMAGRTDTSQDFIWIGQRNIGLSVVKLEAISDSSGVTIGFDDTVLQQLDSGRSLCYFLPTQLPEYIAPTSVNNDPVVFSALIALDYNTNDIVLLGDTDNNQEYEELMTIPLQTDSSENLDIVDVISFGGPGLLPRYMVVLLTNGVHNGVHRLIVISQDNQTREISQMTVSWQEGVPIKIMQGNFGGNEPENQFVEDLIVINSTSTQSLFFDNITDRSIDAAKPPEFADPVLFPVDIGAGSAVRVQHRNGTAMEEVLISFPDTGELRLFNVPP